MVSSCHLLNHSPRLQLYHITPNGAKNCLVMLTQTWGEVQGHLSLAQIFGDDHRRGNGYLQTGLRVAGLNQPLGEQRLGASRATFDAESWQRTPLTSAEGHDEIGGLKLMIEPAV